MITEYAADPRRANWLTISMSEDLCWPEENGTNRPSWELEAEILRLTTRMMMRERELRQVKGQMKTQAHWAEQEVANWRRKMVEKEEQMQLLLVQKDTEMQAIVSQLILFEAELKQEQKKIENLLKEKDTIIHKQKEEIKRLQFMMNKGISDTEERHVTSVTSDGDHLPYSDGKNAEVTSVSKSQVMNCQIENNRTDKNRSIRGSGNDLQAFSDRNVPSNTINGHLSSRRHTVDSSDSLFKRSSSYRSQSPMVSSELDGRKSKTAVTVSSESSTPYLCHVQAVSDVDSRISASRGNGDSDAALKKFKDGLVRIRAIQDLTNVKSRPEKTLIPDIRSENFLGEKRRIAHKTPQKMKDLKAKRINVQHRSHRSELCGQVIL